jgi:geranylgeranyl pyrophosphate synthase
VAFQILNDLKDWESDDDNKRTTGSDLLGGRPTLLWALALEGLKPELREELINLADQTDMPVRKRLLRARQLYLEAGVFETAHRLIDKHQQRAEQVADGIEPDELRRLMYYLVDTVLDRVVDVKPTIQFTDLSFSEIVPIVSPETGH